MQLSHSGLIKVKLVVWMLCLAPLFRLVVGAWMHQLGTNPIELITRSTGTWTLVFLCCSLAVTPLRVMSGWTWLAHLRRLLGLFAFFYALLHMATWVWFDQWFDLTDMVKDIYKRPFITVGFLAVVLLLPLALTSSRAMMKRLGRNWARLHKLVYVIAPLGVLHYLWLVKLDITEPLLYGFVVAALLGWRFWRMQSSKNLAKQQRQQSEKQSSVSLRSL
jgi:methionine sulfoxide reductase heme-binding subunit